MSGLKTAFKQENMHVDSSSFCQDSVFLRLEPILHLTPPYFTKKGSGRGPDSPTTQAEEWGQIVIDSTALVSLIINHIH